ncbi:hypothetical protein BKA63DRAFT_540198 [Paraphoma chrysanthemicola]|nr:hypothetical protein BKA63DRAFT_540198 [Paraphoma chrysanthemicola]
MSASPTTSRGLAHIASQRPTTPDQTRASIARTGSGSVAPKSEYLRNALQARRAHQTPTPSPLDMRAAAPPTPKRPNAQTSKTSPDIFAEFALSEAQTTPVSPIRRRRPSDAGMPRSKTNRELTVEIEKLKDVLMTSNMRVELLKKNNSDLQHELTKVKERVEELEPLEEENNELKDENNYLRLRVQDMEEEMARVKDDNDALRKSNEEMLSINVECSSHWEDQEYAVQEAADTIIALETEKVALASEVKNLKRRVVALEDESSRASTLVHGSTRCPSRVYSIDESRPSTSHFDSDYYSQPDSPQIKDSRESVVSVTPSERSKKFLDSTQERRRSARDLAKRMSAASLKALRIRSPSPTPEVPQIPAMFQQQIPTIVEQIAADRRSSRTPKRTHTRVVRTSSSPSAICVNLDGGGNRSQTHEEWAAMPPPPVPTRSSLLSETDLTSEVDPEDRDRWWKNVDRLNQPQTQSQAAPSNQRAIMQTHSRHHSQSRSPTLTRSISYSQTQADVPSHPGKQGMPSSNSGLKLPTVRTEVSRARTQPNTPAATAPYADMGRDFFFNATEDEDTFLRKAKGRMGGTRRRE